jgi:hypothetical protein
VLDRTLRQALARGELVRVLYRLGRHDATGLLTITGQPSTSARAEVFALRRGQAMAGASELDRKVLHARLARLASAEVELVFDGGVTGVLPVGASRGVSLADWARAHLEAQLDGTLAESLVRELAGARLVLRPELAPEPHDEADRRMLAAMAQPRRLDQIWPMARTPKFRLLAFVHFLRAVDAVEVVGVTARPAPPPSRRGLDPARAAALRVLGIDDLDPELVKRAYRRLARMLHPDLQPDLDVERRRALERRLAEVTTAYETLR